MIVVNTNLSYPHAMPAGRVDFDALMRLTAGDWPPMREGLLEVAADVLVGTYCNVVTVVYEIQKWTRLADGKLRFDVTPSTAMQGWIGQPMPGGPWRRGEARGIRRVTTSDDPPRDVLRTWKGAVASTARQLLAPDDVADHEISVATRADGTIVVSVPAGAPVLIQPRKNPVRIADA